MNPQRSTDPFLLGRRHFLALPLAGAAAATIGGQAHAEPGQPDLDIVLRRGTVIDGSGDARYVADVGIDNGYVVAVGDLSGARAGHEIDASGLVVCPGFVDVHSHGALGVLPVAESSLRQGVTTEILQPDGGGVLRIAERLSIEEDGLGINIGAYIGFNTVWSTVVGGEDRRATPTEIAIMRRRVASGLENGAWGVSAGLEYTPAFFAETDQVIAVSEAARPWRTNFPNHIRNQNYQVVEAVEETIAIGENAGLVPVITHMKIQGPDNWGRSVQAVGQIEAAIDRGTYAAGDVYPYLAGQTGINIVIPQWVRDGGEQAMFDRFDDPELRPQIEQEIEEQISARVLGPEDIWIRALDQTLAEAAATRWDDSPVTAGEAVMRIRQEEGNLSSIIHQGSEDDLRRFLLSPTTAVASDGGATTSATTHPRRYGTQPRVLGHYVRDEGMLGLEEAVFKITYLPATIIGMVDRGLLVPGMVADVTVFDPDTIIDRATYEQPRQLADGVEHVIVNGQLALRDGQLTGIQPGRSLRRSGGMISRPATGATTVRAAAHGRLVPHERPEPDGAVFATDFSGDAAGHSPTGWTQRWREGDWTVLADPPGLRMGATSGRRALTWDAVGEIDGDVELFGRVRGRGNVNLFQLGVLISGDAGDENTFFLRARLQTDSDTPNQLQFFRYLGGGSNTQVRKVLPFPVQEDTWYRVLVQRQGEWLRGKMWPDVADEPADWQVQVSVYETEPLGIGSGESMGPGGVGPAHCCSGGENEWSFLSAGTGGHRAPRLPGDPPPVTDEWRQAQMTFTATGQGATTRGHLVLTDQDRGITFRNTLLGKLQVTDGWASVTGRGQLAGEHAERSFLLLLDQHDLLRDGTTTVTVEIEGGYALTGMLDGGTSTVETA